MSLRLELQLSIISESIKPKHCLWSGNHGFPWVLSWNYNICILPIILYGTECWALSKADARKIDALDQWCLRRILDIRWYHRVSNREVRRMTAVSSRLSYRKEDSCCLATWPEWTRQLTPGGFWLVSIRVIGVGQLGAPTPPGWPLWRATYLSTILSYLRGRYRAGLA